MVDMAINLLSPPIKNIREVAVGVTNYLAGQSREQSYDVLLAIRNGRLIMRVYLRELPFVPSVLGLENPQHVLNTKADIRLKDLPLKKDREQ